MLWMESHRTSLTEIVFDFFNSIFEFYQFFDIFFNPLLFQPEFVDALLSRILQVIFNFRERKAQIFYRSRCRQTQKIFFIVKAVVILSVDHRIEQPAFCVMANEIV